MSSALRLRSSQWRMIQIPTRRWSRKALLALAVVIFGNGLLRSHRKLERRTSTIFLNNSKSGLTTGR
jgi:hypothetical protein